MGARFAAGRLAPRLGEDLSALQVVACAAILYFADWAFLASGASYFPGGLFDEAAHLMTALLLLQGIPPKYRAKIIVPTLIASVAVDLDHIPEYLGFGFFSAGTPRPYAHSLLTPLILLCLALAMSRHRKLLLGLALGVCLHFFRDLAEGNGAGVSLLWPVSNHAYSYPHGRFLALMACVIAADLGIAILKQRTRVATS